MSWVTVTWSMVASACLTLAAVHLLGWCQRRSQWAYLLFAIAAAGTAGVSAVELWLMHAATPAQFAAGVRWLHVPMWVVFVALVPDQSPSRLLSGGNAPHGAGVGGRSVCPVARAGESDCEGAEEVISNQ